jgi:hypothetical protein
MFGVYFPETAFAAGHALAKAVFDCARMIADHDQSEQSDGLNHSRSLGSIAIQAVSRFSLHTVHSLWNAHHVLTLLNHTHLFGPAINQAIGFYLLRISQNLG